jgi:hypothetical protein
VAFVKLTFNPGISGDVTNYAGEGNWFDCNRARFRAGFPKSIGGWQKASPFSINGVSRGMHNWVTTFNDNFLAIGTNSKLYIEAGGNFADITPLRSDTPTIGPPATNNSVSTTLGSNVVVMTLTAPHQAVTGEFVTVSGAVDTGGIPAAEINGNHEVLATSAFAFSFRSTTLATATVAGGGGAGISLAFEIVPGSVAGAKGYGWGAGPWGRNAWGLGANKPISLSQLDWFYDNFDNDLVCNIRLGGIYFWPRGANLDPQIPLGVRAISLADQAQLDGYDPLAVPAKVMQISMSQQDQHLIAFGATPYGGDPEQFDPMLIRWSDQTNITDWTPTPLNSAGDIRLSRGSKIIRGLPTRQEILVWTDAKLYTMQFLGTTDVYGVQEYADNISVMSPRAMITAANITYWMGQDKFYAYSGRVDTLPCTVRRHVFGQVNLAQAQQVVCGTNEEWNEVWWFYPTGGNTYNDSYVIYNYADNLWYYGTLQRSGWLDSPLRMVPQAMRIADELPPNPDTGSLQSFLINQESGVNDENAPLNSYILSNDFDLGDGDNFMLTRRLVPDLTFFGSNTLTPEVLFQIFPRRFPGSSPDSDADDTARVVSYNITNYTEQVFLRARTRQLGFKLVSDKIDVAWQLGVPRLDLRQDGRA